MFLQILVLQALTKISKPVNRKDLLGQTPYIFLRKFCQRYVLNQCSYLKFGIIKLITKKLMLKNKKVFPKAAT